MKSFNKNKKAFSLPSESIITIFTLILLGMFIFFQNFLNNSSKETFETSFKEINYAYPKAVVISFINYPLDKKTKQKYGLDVKTEYTIKDLMEKFDAQTIQSDIEVYKKKYLVFLEKDNSIDKFKYFSNSNFPNSDSLKVSLEYKQNYKEAESYIEQGLNNMKNDEYIIYIPCPPKDPLKNYLEMCLWSVEFN